MSDQTVWPEVPANEQRRSNLGSATVPSKSRAGRRRWVALTLVIALLLSGMAVATWIAYTNKTRADRWRSRSVALQRNVDALNALLVGRTALLNARGAQLNELASKVQQSQHALSQSEGDVQSLVTRQRQLANEKAQLEDERSALTDVASAYITCKGDLENAIQALGNSDYSWIDANAPTVQADCNSADSSLQGFLAAYPNG